MGDANNNLSAAFAPTPDCLPIDELAIVLEGRRGEILQRRAESHTAACPHCRTELALLREFESPTIRPHEQRDVKWIAARLRKNSQARTSWWKQIWTVRVFAPASIVLATAVIAIGIGLHMRQATISAVPDPGREVMRSQSLDIMTPLGDLAAPPAELKWQAVAGASQYQVRLLEVDHTELWKTTVSQTSVGLNNAIRDKIVPLKTLIWEVTALNNSGAEIASSGFKAFRLQGRVLH